MVYMMAATNDQIMAKLNGMDDYLQGGGRGREADDDRILGFLQQRRFEDESPMRAADQGTCGTFSRSLRTSNTKLDLILSKLN